MIKLLPIFALTALATPASAVTLPPGWVPATAYVQAPGERHTKPLYIPKKWCGTKIPALVQDETDALQPASAGAICR